MQDESRVPAQDEDVDLHARWAALEAQHASKKMRLMVIVGVVMVVLVVFWGITVSDTVQRITHAAQSTENVRDTFSRGFDSYQKELNSFGTATSTDAASATSSVRNEDVKEFVELLKSHAVDVTASSSAKR